LFGSKTRRGVLRRCFAVLALVAAGATSLACASAKPAPPPRAEPIDTRITDDVYRRAAAERVARLEREIERLNADLRQAEDVLVAAESGMRGQHTRADAVSSLAAVRIQLERARSHAPWRSAEIAEADEKLEEAGRLIDEGHFGAAVFFVYRARRISDLLQTEADAVRSRPGARFVRGRRVNLRSGPSIDEAVLAVLTSGTPVFPERDSADWVLVRTAAGPVGWMHRSLLERP
jgi:uncharacterized small protein (DUF1192 family)